MLLQEALVLEPERQQVRLTKGAASAGQVLVQVQQTYSEGTGDRRSGRGSGECRREYSWGERRRGLS